MSQRKVDTSINDLLSIVKDSESDPIKLNVLTKSLQSLIPVKHSRKIPMTDTNLNKMFTIKRINYSVLGKVESRDDNMYNVRIISIVDGTTNVKNGDLLSISKRELEITGRHTSSKS